MLRVLLQKARIVILLTAAAPLLFLARILKPFAVMRFGHLTGERIGHFAANTELYLCERELGMHRPRSIDFFYHRGFICNQQLKKMWGRKLHVWQFSRWLDRLNRLLPGGRDHVIPIPWDRDMHCVVSRTKAHLSFDIKEERLGMAELKKMGIPEGAPFVCIYAREKNYLDTVFKDSDWRYHGYRNSDISSYIPAAQELARRGYFVLRVGALVKDKLAVNNPMIIDYGTGYRTDFLDIFLCAKNKFFVGSTGGINAVPRIFRKPVAYVNFVPLGLDHLFTCAPESLFIPKKLWVTADKRFMAFREMIESGADRFFRNEQYEKLGVEVLENSPEEIASLVIEMDESLNGTWHYVEEDRALQERFWSILNPNKFNKTLGLRIGTEFLRKNQELLA